MSGYWWIASPRDNGSMLNVDQIVGRFGSQPSYFDKMVYQSVRPIVCIKTTVFKEKYEETLESNYIGKAINAEKYGEEVIGYECTDADAQTEAGAWRLFYQNAAYTYLISDNKIPISSPLESLYTTAGWGEKTGADVSKIGQALNPMFKNIGGFTSSNTTENVKAVGYVAEPTKWEKYKGTDALFAIGGPSIELFIESFNAAGKVAKDGRKELTVTVTGINGYDDAKATADDFKTSQNHGIYRKSTTSWWWLASPNCDSTGIRIVADRNGSFIDDGKGEGRSVRPLICIPTSIFQQKYESSLVDE